MSLLLVALEPTFPAQDVLWALSGGAILKNILIWGHSLEECAVWGKTQGKWGSRFAP